MRRRTVPLALTSFAMVMVVVNIIEACLIDAIGSSGHAMLYVVGVPVIILFAMMVAIVLWCWRERAALKENWHDAKREQCIRAETGVPCSSARQLADSSPGSATASQSLYP
jgi:hypothetical protein